MKKKILYVSTKQILRIIKQQKPKLICINVFAEFFDQVNYIVKRVKKISNAFIVYFGRFATISPKDCLKFADGVCIGESYRYMPRVIEKFLKNKFFKDMPNFWFKGKPKQIRDVIIRLEYSINDVWFPNLNEKNTTYIYKGKLYHGEQGFSDNVFRPDKRYHVSSIYHTITSFNCPLDCSFCFNLALRKKYPVKKDLLKRRPAEDVIDELRKAKKQNKNLKKIRFLDDIFACDEKWIKKFSRLYKKYVNIPFYAYGHANLTTENIIRYLKQAGWEETEVSVNCFLENKRKKYFRRFETDNDIFNFVHLLHKYKISYVFDEIVDLPFISISDQRKILHNYLKLPKPFIVRFLSIQLYPYTDITKYFIKKGLTKEFNLVKVAPKLRGYFTSFRSWQGKNKKIMYRKYLLFVGTLLGTNKYINNKLISFLIENRFIEKHLLIQKLIIFNVKLFHKFKNYFYYVFKHPSTSYT
nr:radical SAM protein [Nanoarchaeota archaeon]